MSPEPFARLVRARLEEGADLRREFADACGDRIQKAAQALGDCLRRGNKILALGNGGSAADAQHFAAELIGRFGRDRAPLPVLALTTDTSALTAIGNDFGFREVFARQVRALAGKGDVVVGISTSGRSRNVIRAIRAARAAGAHTIALSGGDGGELASLADIAIVAPTSDTARIQELHITVVHILCELIESTLFPPGHDNPAIVHEPTVVMQWEELIPLREEWRQEGKTVVWTNGCFDVLHVGHVHLLEQAKLQGDVLVVGVNTDASVKELKGQGRPIFPIGERMRVLAALEATDAVVSFEGTTPEAALEQLKPDVHVKGEDYAPPSGKPMPERPVVEAYGGRIEFVSLLPERSTSEAIHRIREAEGGGT